MAGRVAFPPTEEERGVALETLLLNELRAYTSYANLQHPLFFWRSQSGVEADCFCEKADGFVAVEVKVSERWDKRHNRGLNRMRQELGQNRVACYGVHPGKRPANWDGIQVLPNSDFLKRLWDGEILRACRGEFLTPPRPPPKASGPCAARSSLCCRPTSSC